MKLICICGNQQLLQSLYKSQIKYFELPASSRLQRVGSQSFNTESVLQKQISGSVLSLDLMLQYPHPTFFQTWKRNGRWAVSQLRRWPVLTWQKEMCSQQQALGKTEKIHVEQDHWNPEMATWVKRFRLKSWKFLFLSHSKILELHKVWKL